MYKYGGKLLGERTRKPLSFELLFVDDGVIVSCTRQDMEQATKFDEVAAMFELTLSVVKTTLFVAGSNLKTWLIVHPWAAGGVSTYLGSFVETSGSVLSDVQDKVGRACGVFWALCSFVFIVIAKSFSLSTKRMVYCSMVLGRLLYGAGD